MSGRVSQGHSDLGQLSVACDSRKLVQNCLIYNLEIVWRSCEIMNALRTVGDRDMLLLVIMICIFQAVSSEDCKAVDGSYCHCRTESGYEINLTPLVSNQGPA